MIFVTVGSQLPFDRLIQAVDHWCAENKSIAVFAQIGISNYAPEHIDFCQTMTPDIYHEHLQKADLIIAHAGMGTIISALELGKPLLLMPRLTSQGEHRNDHQLATAKHFAHLSNVTVVNNETELLAVISPLIAKKIVYSSDLETSVAPSLINAIKEFVNT